MLPVASFISPFRDASGLHGCRQPRPPSRTLRANEPGMKGGSMHALLALLLTLAAEAGTPLAVPEAQARNLFAKMRSLEGEWNGASTRGWTDRVTFRAIAEGSVVVSTSFEAHPGETMMTMYHMDGSRLMLTHYCMAKNQPRLVAT